jgi:hypothetical protein
MILNLTLPLLSPHMSEAVIECLFSTSGSELKTGAKLLDVSVDLSSAFAQECPPISFFRIIMRENVFLRELRVSPGQRCKAGEVIAIFGTTANEAGDQVAAQRAVRFATAGIVHHSKMWTGSDH